MEPVRRKQAQTAPCGTTRPKGLAQRRDAGSPEKGSQSTRGGFVKNPLWWMLGGLAVAAVLGIAFNDQLAAMGIGPNLVWLVAILAVLGAAFLSGRMKFRLNHLVIWLAVLAGLGLAYLYIPGLAEWFASR